MSTLYRGDAGQIRSIVRSQGIESFEMYRDSRTSAGHRRYKLVVASDTPHIKMVRALRAVGLKFGKRIRDASDYTWVSYSGPTRSLVVSLWK